MSIEHVSTLSGDSPRPIVGVNLLTCGRPEHPEFLRATKVAVRSLQRSDLGAWPYRIVVVDNGSTDRTPDWCEKVGLEVLRLPENIGIPAGRNAGYRRLLEDPAVAFVVEMHNDMIFPQTWLAPLMAAMAQDPQIGIACPRLLTQLGSLGSPRLRIDYTQEPERLIERVDAAASQHRRPGVVRPGLQHPALKRRAMLEQIGLYDEDFGRGNFEDTDEIYRAGAAGWRYVIVGDAVVFHHYWLSRFKLDPKQQAVTFHANHAYFLRKWPDAGDFLRRYNAEIGAIYR